MESEQRTLIVAGHPDDEIIGAGIWMARHRDHDLISIAHVTGGSSRDHANPNEYAKTRRHELLAAVGLAGIRPDQCRELGFIDQEAYLHLTELTDCIRALIAELRPERILTHPYEGGHPDHDAAAFAVAQAVRNHYEFTSYHLAGDFVAGEFLPAPGAKEESLEFGPADRDLKQAMLDSFATQQDILRLFPVERERFRVAPAYDFTNPPHEGELQYERWGFATGSEWRRHAAEALAAIRNRDATA
jgi:LmbE family N-acetylglucosaminyl deacetylase